jgi:hypothetical protein
LVVDLGGLDVKGFGDMILRPRMSYA